MFQEAARASFWQQVQARAVEAMPALTATIVVLAFGLMLGWLARRVVLRLFRTRKRRWPPETLGWGSSLDAWNRPWLVARSVQAFVIFCSTIVALYALDPRLASILAERVLLYLPRLASGVLILVAGLLLSKYAGRGVLIAAVNHDVRPARLLASVTRTALVVLAAAIALEEAGIGERTVLVAFGIFFGGLMLAVAIALRLALQSPVSQWIADQGALHRRHEHEEDRMHHV